MKKQISIYISELLFLHDCVIIPDFGGFVGNNTSSVIKKNIIHPPSKEILFNKNLTTNDGLLLSHIAKSEKISNKKAKDLVKKFVINLKLKLKENKAFRLDKIGLLSINSNGNILFLQDYSTNYNTNAFGMSSQNISSVHRLKEITKQIIHPSSLRSEKRRIWKAAAILIPLIGISLISITQKEKIDNLYSQVANLNPFEILNNNPQKMPQEKVTRRKLNVKKPGIKPNIKKEINRPQLPKKKFFVIAGSFSDQKNAESLVKKLKSKNYKSYIVGRNKDGLLRVCYDSFYTKKEANSLLINLKLDNKSAWILSL